MSRAGDIAAFLESQDLGRAQKTILAGDASARRYYRLLTGRRCLLMDVPPESRIAMRPYLEVTAWLRHQGFGAPEIFAADSERGLALIEDLGDDLFAAVCKREPDLERAMYEAAVDLIAGLQTREPPGAGGGWTPPPYDMATLMREARLFIEWYVPAATGAGVSPAEADEFERLAHETFAAIPHTPAVAVLRDYHAENLIWLRSREGDARVGLLDYQDMLIGHPAYDLVSLLDDARRDVTPALREELFARYLNRTGRETGEFMHAAQALSAQRNMKIMGLFTRLCRRDGKPRYLNYLPRVWDNLTRNLTHPALADLRGWAERHAPAPNAQVQTLIGRVAA